MSVKYIGQAIAKVGKNEEFKAFVEQSIMPILISSKGCDSCNLYMETESSNKFLLIERWDSIESHRRAIKKIPVDAYNKFMDLVSEAPKGSHYNLIYDVAVSKVD
ncbi:MAG: antibiotic biosynthesis monooxygenase [Melioribacteraceae bacterium]|nr:antibiotic biosynthesis monooxygenase [Melioribacteraceae bacterium]MCF8263550.1 antibiotic biosynthesis monooxygenase [Melioribacteraceae bacterium]MCF8430676.1 antibiotic biosynthesis monooxygenase [Melioribacteraceae bacterium]